MVLWEVLHPLIIVIIIIISPTTKGG